MKHWKKTYRDEFVKLGLDGELLTEMIDNKELPKADWWQFGHASKVAVAWRRAFKKAIGQI